MAKKILISFFISLFFYGCKEEIALDPEALGLNYYPLHTGEYWIYKVTETSFKDQFEAQATDSVSYYVRERIDTVYQDLTQEETYKFTRSRRNSLTEEWGADSVFVVNKSNTSVRVNQNNRKVVSFIFPVVEGKRWNAHIFNTHSSFSNKSEEKFYYFSDKGISMIINGNNYSNTVKVIQTLNDNAIERQDLFEVYGYGVGRIYKQVLSYNYCSDPGRQNGCEVGQQFIITGKKRIEKLLEHGITK